ncbi:MAG: hypothetical protein H0W42_03225 [Gemmatimonadaceae bacterium]|nr:hypothetical protein [Gemmatimonadaceae bacterium]
MTGVSLRELARLSKDLNKASDALSEQITHVEAALNELKLGIDAWVTVVTYVTQSDNGLPLHETEYLGYGKHKGKWSLLYQTEVDEFPEESGYKVPLRDAPRVDRIRAVDKLPDLVQALEKRTKELSEQATAKATQVANFAAALKR